MSTPSSMEQYMFDLRGYTILENALDADHVKAMNDWIDALPPLDGVEWHGNVQVASYRGKDVDGINLQHIYEAGEIFERLIDHPAWIDLVRFYLGKRAKPSIHELFLNVRGRGGFIGAHGGGWIVDGRAKGGIDRGQWCVQYMSLIAALNDIGPGDGATFVVPSSHKSEFKHPKQKEGGGITPEAGDDVDGGVEIHLKAGDVLMFNDILTHGSVARTNPGHRRTIVFRYLPSVFAHRHGYVPSDELLERLTPQQRDIVLPMKPTRAPASAAT